MAGDSIQSAAQEQTRAAEAEHFSKTQWRGGTLLGPVPPAMVSVADPARPQSGNIITVAWTGIVNTIPPKAYISVRPTRYSYPLLIASGEFVINLTTASLVRAADFCGIHTGAKVDKFEACGLTPIPANTVGAPLIAQSPLSLECKLDRVIELGSHHMLLCDITAVDVDTALIDANGKLHLERADLCGFAHGTYYALGAALGTFGFAVKRKKRKPAAAAKQPAQKAAAGRIGGQAGKAPGKKRAKQNRNRKK